MRYFILCLSAFSVALLTLFLQKKTWQTLQILRQGFTTTAQSDFRSLFLFFDVSVIWPFILGISIVLAGLAWLLTFNILISLGILVLCWVLPRIVMKWAQRQRIKKFEKQLPDALLSLASTLRAGASFSVALGALLDYSQAPLSEEFGLIEREHRFGVTFSDAFKHLSQRMPSRCVEKIVAAILVSHQTGGELAQTLESTASSMQADLYAQERLSALTAQGVMQAWVMAAMPIGLAMMMNMLDDTFSDQLFNTSVGQRILWAIILLEIIGLWWLKKITRVTYA